MAVIEVKNPVLKSGEHYLTSDYKTRNPKRSGKNGTRAHNGMDFVARKNNKNTSEYIVAIDNGTVYSVGYGASSGYYVKIKHDNGYLSLYYHLKKGSTVVKKGAKVVKGQILGYMGTTGNSTGVHLHFGIYTGEEYLDPKPYLQGKTGFQRDDLIEEDGVWGKDTTRRAQEVFKTTVDGVVSNQKSKYEEENPGLSPSTFEWESNPGKSGSSLIKAIQKKVGVKQDGFIGPDTIKAMQKWLGTTQDGKVSKPSQMVKAFQKWLNQQ